MTSQYRKRSSYLQALIAGKVPNKVIRSQYRKRSSYLQDEDTYDRLSGAFTRSQYRKRSSYLQGISMLLNKNGVFHVTIPQAVVSLASSLILYVLHKN